jgi:NADH-quinone oxidoreductase subunit A
MSTGVAVPHVPPRSTLLASASDVVGSGGAGLFNDWLPFLIYGIFAAAIPTTMMVGSFVFAQRPHRRVRARTIPFESGVSQGPPKRQRFTVSFYLTAMLFILFDIEIVFLYPLAVILHLLSWFGFFEFLTFLIVLLVAYVYIWRKGALEWR